MALFGKPRLLADRAESHLQPGSPGERCHRFLAELLARTSLLWNTLQGCCPVGSTEAVSAQEVLWDQRPSEEAEMLLRMW